MDLPAIIRGAVDIARDITISAHVTVTHKVWISQAQDGSPNFTSKERLALVEKKVRLVKDPSGRLVQSTAAVYLLEEVPPTAAASASSPRTNPVDPRDVFVLPDGFTGPIVAVDGFFDGGTGVPFYSRVYLG